MRHYLIVCFQATREAVLDRSEEVRETREQAFANASSIYDLLTIMLVRRAQFNLLHEVGCLPLDVDNSGLYSYHHTLCVDCSHQFNLLHEV